jgi:hypothetical protein
MNTDSFFAQYQIHDNPFAAEEARLDPVFTRLMDNHATHPDFPKILGRIDKPSTAVVFGEKGTGKTALRMLISHEIERHNAENPKRRVLEVRYDDFNTVLDNLLQRRGQKTDAVLKNFRLVDHQDAILASAVTRLTDALLGETDHDDEERQMPLPDKPAKAIRQLPRDRRADLAVLAALYDSPTAGSGVARWQRLKRMLGLGWHLPLKGLRWASTIVTVIAVALLAVRGVLSSANEPGWLMTGVIVAAAAAVAGWSFWGFHQLVLWRKARKVSGEMQAISRSSAELRQLFSQLRRADLNRQPLPMPGQADQSERDARYQLTRQFLDVIGGLNFVGMMVLVDRVDEPTAISGDPERMRRLLWPVFDNKFLQQDRIGLKLLLPIELRHHLYRESPQFFQEARLDKQNMVDRLEWSGATLYDLCSARLRACREASGDGHGQVYLTDLFDDDVTEAMLVDALDQMHQPRDAFKFLYQVIQEHCRLVPEDQANFKVARLTLESVRRSQSQRVQELYRGLTPS